MKKSATAVPDNWKPPTRVFHIYQSRETGDFRAFPWSGHYKRHVPQVVKEWDEPFHYLHAKVRAATRELAIHMYCIEEGLTPPEPPWLK